MRRFVPDKWGGTESVVYHLSGALQQQGVKSPVHCCAMFAPPGRDRMGAVDVHRHRYLFPWFGLSAEARRALRLKGGSPLSLSLFFGLLFERRVSLIHTHVQHRLGGMARTVARLKRIPYVVSLHGGHYTLPSDEVERMMQPFRGKIEWGKGFGALFGSRRVLQDADAILCVGRSEFEKVKERFPRKPVFHVSNGVDIGRFERAAPEPFRDAFGFEAADRLVLCVSRIDSQKNQIGLVHAFARFASSHPDHQLVLLGPVSVEGYRDKLQQEILRLGLERKVRLLKGLAPDDPLLPSAYKAAELFVLPSLHEPFGIVVLEAWAAGLPVVASRVGGIPGFAVDGENAVLVEPDSENALAGAMETLAENPQLRHRLAQNASLAVQEYDWKSVAEQVMSIYSKLLHSNY